ncbi:hypothetical protein C7974DRAFT_383613 [Boeremia exigua]|uniref:uncharacterized protein n=1 Tax=Boeremia exigua TaxID=749465 RepID=UPI001E8CD9DA|nr:uncharacterized protein C7974DRAFT_383613 [Boeremia exigua]KAH6644467.1 hypothetical protein C7974DRAFT_383613 [Boeremia exigua]
MSTPGKAARDITTTTPIRTPQSTPGILTAAPNYRKALASKKKAHHIPLHAPARNAPLSDESDSASESDDDSADDTDSDVSTVLLDRGDQVSLRSVDGFCAAFDFDGPAVVAGERLVLKAPGLFRMPVLGGEKRCEGPGAESVDSLALPAMEAVGQALAVSQKDTCLREDTQLSTVSGLVVVQGTAIAAEDVQAAESLLELSLASSRTLVLDSAESVATVYPDVYAALGLPTDTLTPRLVAIGVSIATAARDADARMSATVDLAEFDIYVDEVDVDVHSNTELTAVDENLEDVETDYNDASEVFGDDGGDFSVHFQVSPNINLAAYIDHPAYHSLRSLGCLDAETNHFQVEPTSDRASLAHHVDRCRLQPLGYLDSDDEPAVPAHLTPSFVALRSEMTNATSSPFGRSPCPIAASTPGWPATSPVRAARSEDEFAEHSSPASEPPQPIVSPDWTAELVRTKLGTESLFTFLSTLYIKANGSTTKPALAATFLTLVDAEREKLDLPPLPVACTAPAVLASKILPHTTVLGTTSLATFLAQFRFSADGTVVAEEVYRVFKELCREETAKNMQATVGIMGALGRRLGKLAG